MPNIYINGVNICSPSSECQIEDPNAIGEEDINALKTVGVDSPGEVIELPEDNGDAESINVEIVEIEDDPSKIPTTVIHFNNVNVPEITI